MFLWIVDVSADAPIESRDPGGEGQKDAEGDEKEEETTQTTGKTTFTVLGGFENKPIQKVQ